MKRWLITGTDTEIGKTYVACEWIRLLVEQGASVAAMKPIASGCEQTPDGLRNDDALRLMQAANVSLGYERVNPYPFEPPIAPHIAAAHEGISIDAGKITAIVDKIGADHLVIEGVGGWCVPLGEDLTLAALARALGARVVLVVGMRLGCLNHALLSARQIVRDGCDLAGWIANHLDADMQEYENNLKTLKKRLGAPMLGEVGRGGKLTVTQSDIDQSW